MLYVGAERTMALLAFEDTRSSPVADLMDISQRQKTASELNAAILSSQCQVCTIPSLSFARGFWQDSHTQPSTRQHSCHRASLNIAHSRLVVVPAASLDFQGSHMRGRSSMSLGEGGTLIFGMVVCQETEPRLPTLLKLLLWAQNQLDNKLQYPRMVDLVAGRLSDPADVNQMC